MFYDLSENTTKALIEAWIKILAYEKGVLTMMVRFEKLIL